MISTLASKRVSSSSATASHSSVQLISRARGEGHVSAPMLAQIAGQARILLAR